MDCIHVKKWTRNRRSQFLLLICVLVTTYVVGLYIDVTGNVEEKWNLDKYTITGKPVNHIGYIKVPKTASTMVQNIFLRYADENNLVIAVSKFATDSFTNKTFYPPPKNRSYDICAEHVYYNRNDFHRALPSDTKYFGTIREPFKRFGSHIRFSRPGSVLNISGDDIVMKYLSNTKYRNKGVALCNAMAMYFGIYDRKFLNMDKRKAHEYKIKLAELDKDMDMVIVFEYLEESIVLMRRTLNWDLRHVLYGNLRINKKPVDKRLKFGPVEEELYRKCSQLDNMLYNYFVRRLKEKIRNQPPDFFEELSYFRKTKKRYENFCLSTLSNGSENKRIIFEGSPWNKPFVVTAEHCRKKLYIRKREYMQWLKVKQSQ